MLEAALPVQVQAVPVLLKQQNATQCGILHRAASGQLGVGRVITGGICKPRSPKPDSASFTGRCTCVAVWAVTVKLQVATKLPLQCALAFALCWSSHGPRLPPRTVLSPAEPNCVLQFVT